MRGDGTIYRGQRIERLPAQSVMPITSFIGIRDNGLPCWAFAGAAALTGIWFWSPQLPVLQEWEVSTSQQHSKEVSAGSPTSRQSASVSRLIGLRP